MAILDGPTSSLPKTQTPATAISRGWNCDHSLSNARNRIMAKKEPSRMEGRVFLNSTGSFWGTYGLLLDVEDDRFASDFPGIVTAFKCDDVEVTGHLACSGCI